MRGTGNASIFLHASLKLTPPETKIQMPLVHFGLFAIHHNLFPLTQNPDNSKDLLIGG